MWHRGHARSKTCRSKWLAAHYRLPAAKSYRVQMSAGRGRGRAELRPDGFSIPAQLFSQGDLESRRTKRCWEVFLRSAPVAQGPPRASTSPTRNWRSQRWRTRSALTRNHGGAGHPPTLALPRSLLKPCALSSSFIHIVPENIQANGRREIGGLPVSGNARYQMRQCLAPLLCNVSQSAPESIFKADARSLMLNKD